METRREGEHPHLVLETQDLRSLKEGEQSCGAPVAQEMEVKFCHVACIQTFLLTPYNFWLNEKFRGIVAAVYILEVK